jgi:uncharacterized protein
MNYHKLLETQRDDKNTFFKKHPRSPLDERAKRNFKRLEYYSIDEKYRFSLSLNPDKSRELIEMETSDGDNRVYERIGYLEFEIDGQIRNIHVYQSKDNTDHYFVPFRDKTSVNETYGAGRYLDLEFNDGKFELDFNKAYNPYCAYNYNFSCPLPPSENWLDIPIYAGEKDYKQ